MKKIFTILGALMLTTAMNAQQLAKMPKIELVKTNTPSAVYTGELSTKGFAPHAVPFKAPATTEVDTVLEGQYYIEDQMYRSHFPGYISGLVYLITPYSDTTYYQSVHGSGDWVYDGYDESGFPLTIKEENTAVLAYPSSYYGWNFNNPTLSVYPQKIPSADGSILYNVTFTDYMYAYAAEAYWPGQIAPTHMMNGYWYPELMTNCEMMNADRSGDQGNAGNRYMVSSGAAGTSWCFGSGMTISSWGAGTLDTLVNIIPVPKGASMWCDTVFVHCYNRDATSIEDLFPASTNLKLTIYPIIIYTDPETGKTTQYLRHDSIMAEATATQAECVEDGGGYSIKFAFKDGPAVLGQRCYAELTGFNESGCNFGIYCDYWPTPTGGRTLWLKDGRFHSYGDMNIDMAFNAYYPDIHYITNTCIEEIGGEGGFLQMSGLDENGQKELSDTLTFDCNIMTDFEGDAKLYDANGNEINVATDPVIADYEIISGPYEYMEDDMSFISLGCRLQIKVKPNLSESKREQTVYLKAYGTQVPITIKQASALVPTIMDLLSAGYDVTNKYVFAIHPDEEVCNPIVWAGTYNGWATDPDDMLHFEALDGFDGWYVVEVEDNSLTVKGKPVQLKWDSTFSWKYQSGDVWAWINMDQPYTQTASIMSEYDDEALITLPAKGAYIYELAYWKKHQTSCVVIPTHDYTITAYLPEFCDEIAAYADSVRVMGGFDNWTDGIWMEKKVDQNFNRFYYAKLYGVEEDTEFKIRFGSDEYWEVQVQKDGINLNNEKTGAEENIVLLFNGAGYGFAACAAQDIDMKPFIEYVNIANTFEYPYYPSWSEESGKLRILRDNGLQDLNLKAGVSKIIFHKTVGTTGQILIYDPNWAELAYISDWYGDATTLEYVLTEYAIKCINGDITDGWSETAFILMGDGLEITKIAIEIGESPFPFEFVDAQSGLTFLITDFGEVNNVKVISNNGEYPTYSGDIVIPSTVNYHDTTFTVTEIGDRAFYGCSGLTSITIPESVTTIENGVLSNCVGLTSINVDVANTHYSSTDGVLFNDAKDTLIQYPIGNTRTEYTIPNSVTTIGDWAFEDCTGLTSVILGNSVKTIEWGAFRNCSGLTSVTILNSVTTIKGATFEGCSSLTSITIPNSVTAIEGWGVFSNCTSLESVIIGNSVKTIGNGTFNGCSRLTSITIPNSVTKIEAQAFSWSGLKDVSVNWASSDQLPTMESEVFIGIANTEGPSAATLHVPAGTKSIYENADQWKDFGTIKDGINDDDLVVGQQFEVDNIWYEITSLGQTNTVKVYWYVNYSSPTSLVIPASVSYKDYTFAVTEIYGWTFANNANITSIVLPNTLETIGEGAFYGCSNITSVTAPASFFDVPESYWSSYPKQFTSVVVNGGELSENGLLYLQCSKKTLKTLDVAGATNTELTDEAFNGYYNLETLRLPSSLESIGYMAVAGNINIKSIDIPAPVIEIGQRAFENCRSIVTINFKGNVLRKISDWAFYNAHQLKSLTLPDGVAEIGEGAFYGCVYLENLDIPHSVKSIGNNSFALCSELNKMTVHSVTPPTIEAKTFDEVNRQIPVYVPEEAVADYKEADYWKEFNIVAIEDVTNLESVRGSQSTMQKVLRNGQILLERNGVTYTLMGQKVK